MASPGPWVISQERPRPRLTSLRGGPSPNLSVRSGILHLGPGIDEAADSIGHWLFLIPMRTLALGRRDVRDHLGQDSPNPAVLHSKHVANGVCF